MAPAVRVFRQFRASNTRVKAATLTGLAGLVLALAFVTGVLPAIAESDGPDVDPVVVEYGGGAGACDFVDVDSAAEHELHLNNPQTGEFTGPDGTTKFAITVDGDFLDFEVLTPGMGVYDVVINGGSHNNHFDYDDNGDGPVQKDDGLHAPQKGGGNSPPHNLSHTNICYDELPLGSVSGTKYHDNDADGTQDPSQEFEIEGWTIAAFDSDGNLVGSDDTDSDGFYKIDNLAPDTYTICEQTNTSGLPSASPEGVTWAWTQSEPSGDDVCSGFDEEGEDGVTYLPLGYNNVEVNGNDVENIDFGNHRQVTVACGDEDIEVTLGGEGEPTATVTFPANCDSEAYTTSFDLGLSDDGDDWTQFVVFGGDPTSTQELEQTIVWEPEPSNYVDGELVVPTTQVLLDLTDTSSEPVDVTFCHTDPDLPDSDTPQCLDSRTITETAPSDPEADYLTDIQLTETYKLLGDPGNFR